jgi:hypothetical protein
MPLETAEYFDTLQPDWPLGTDPESQGDDHLRMIKQVIQNTFPAFNSAVLGTSDDLSNVSVGVLYSPADAEQTLPSRFDMLTPGSTDSDPHAAVLALTCSAQMMTTHPNIVPTWAAIQNLIYPQGSVIISSNAANPATYLGFGTWAARIGTLYGVGQITDGNGLSAGIGAGVVAGEWRIGNNHIIAAAITLAMDAVAPHTHTYDQTNTDNGHYGDTGYGGTHKTGTSGSGGGHTPTGKVTIGAGSATSGDVHYSPGYALYIWERTA